MDNKTSKKLRIAIGATLHKKLDSNSSGGTEVFSYLLSKELVKRGHRVDVFASGDSNVEGNLQGISEESEINVLDQNQNLFYGYQLLESELIASQESRFDIIHANYFEPFLFAPFSKLIQKPVVFTVHSDLLDSEKWQKVIEQMIKPSDKLIFVSKSAMDRAAYIQNKDYIYNGVDTSLFAFSDSSDDYLLWLGRFRQKKGIGEAVELASGIQAKMIISGVMDNTKEKIFFDENLRPRIDSSKNISLVEKPQKISDKIMLYQKAKAFLFPILWEEPFGLVMTEAMSCGTPVIAYAKGAIPEVVRDGVTGFIVNSSAEDIRGDWIIKETGIEGLRKAVEKIYSMPLDQYAQMRRACRQHVEDNFSIIKMVDRYEELYRKIEEEGK